jgi:hypothetical protein
MSSGLSNQPAVKTSKKRRISINGTESTTIGDAIARYRSLPKRMSPRGGGGVVVEGEPLTVRSDDPEELYQYVLGAFTQNNTRPERMSVCSRGRIKQLWIGVPVVHVRPEGILGTDRERKEAAEAKNASDEAAVAAKKEALRKEEVDLLENVGALVERVEASIDVDVVELVSSNVLESLLTEVESCTVRLAAFPFSKACVLASSTLQSLRRDVITFGDGVGTFAWAKAVRESDSYQLRTSTFSPISASASSSRPSSSLSNDEAGDGIKKSGKLKSSAIRSSKDAFAFVVDRLKYSAECQTKALSLDEASVALTEKNSAVAAAAAAGAKSFGVGLGSSVEEMGAEAKAKRIRELEAKLEEGASLLEATARELSSIIGVDRTKARAFAMESHPLDGNNRMFFYPEINPSFTSVRVDSPSGDDEEEIIHDEESFFGALNGIQYRVAKAFYSCSREQKSGRKRQTNEIVKAEVKKQSKRGKKSNNKEDDGQEKPGVRSGEYTV